MSAELPPVDVVIPARGEGARIAKCLEALLDERKISGLRVIVAVNGEEAAETEVVVAALAARFDGAGHELRSIRSAVGKTYALNAGDTLRRNGAVIYLDADVRLQPGALSKMIDVLRCDREPILICPFVTLAPAQSRVSQAFGRVWISLPHVRDSIVGGGCYAVNARGRRLWDAFPHVEGDDVFVCSLFPPPRRLRLSEVQVRLPDRWWDLVRAKARWKRSYRDGLGAALTLCATRPPGQTVHPLDSGRRDWKMFFGKGLASSFPVYLSVEVAARCVNLVCTRGGEGGWRPVRAYDRSASEPVNVHGLGESWLRQQQGRGRDRKDG